MTTAHRPTWKAAVGQANEGGWSAGGARSTTISALDAPAHTKLKVRHGHQQIVDRRETLKRSLLELEEAEIKSSAALPRKPIDYEIEERAKQKLLKQTAEVDIQAIKAKYDDSDIDDGGGGGGSDGDDNSNNNNKDSDLDDDDTDLDDDSDDDSSNDDDDDDDDDEEALQAELAKIRAEREAAKRKEEEERNAEENAKLEQAAVLGNPLLLATSTVDGTSNKKRRRWNDDVVFRNQAKNEPIQQKRFINDTVRNDFHKRFLNKFIR